MRGNSSCCIATIISRKETPGACQAKADPGESVQEAIAREVFEETGYKALPECFSLSHSLNVTHDGYDFVYHVFGHQLEYAHDVRTEEAAHKGYRWVTLEEALSLPLMPDEDQSIALFYRSTEP